MTDAAHPPRWSLSDPRGRRRARLHAEFVDHGLLRHAWTNMAQLAPGVWRSNHPGARRLRLARDAGILTVVSLRGSAPTPQALLEAEACAALGLRFVTVALRARLAPRREDVLQIFEVFRTAERPLLMHCKSGADRAGFASALFLLHEGRPLAEARRQLSLRFLHVRASRTGILDHILDLYAPHEGALGIEEWIRTRYDADAAQAGFR